MFSSAVVVLLFAVFGRSYQQADPYWDTILEDNFQQQNELWNEPVEQTYDIWNDETSNNKIEDDFDQLEQIDFDGSIFIITQDAKYDQERKKRDLDDIGGSGDGSLPDETPTSEAEKEQPETPKEDDESANEKDKSTIDSATLEPNESDSPPAVLNIEEELKNNVTEANDEVSKSPDLTLSGRSLGSSSEKDDENVQSPPVIEDTIQSSEAPKTESSSEVAPEEQKEQEEQSKQSISAARSPLDGKSAAEAKQSETETAKSTPTPTKTGGGGGQITLLIVAAIIIIGAAAFTYNYCKKKMTPAEPEPDKELVEITVNKRVDPVASPATEEEKKKLLENSKNANGVPVTEDREENGAKPGEEIKSEGAREE